MSTEINCDFNIFQPIFRANVNQCDAKCQPKSTVISTYFNLWKMARLATFGVNFGWNMFKYVEMCVEIRQNNVKITLKCPFWLKYVKKHAHAVLPNRISTEFNNINKKKFNVISTYFYFQRFEPRLLLKWFYSFQ